MIRRLFLFLCFLLTTLCGWGAKAFTGPVIVNQSDGTTLTVYAHGDEHFHWYTAEDGALLIERGGVYYVARTDSEGHLLSTELLAHNPSHRSQAESEAVKAQQKDLFLQRGMQRRQKALMRRIPIGSSEVAYFPHTGQPKALVILVNFKDVKFTVPDPKLTFDRYLNSEEPLQNYGYREDRNHGSVRKYFSDMSGGKFKPQFDLVGPYTLSQDEAYYGEDYSQTSYDKKINELMKEACQQADKDVDFSQYDANGDGSVDLVYVIYAGYSQSNGAPASTIWPKSGTGTFGTYDGVSVCRYGVNGELNYYPDRKFKQDPQVRVNGIGLFCHEFSHTLGLPDLYSNLKVDNQEMEYWDLMDGGEYTDNGYTPTPYTPWEKEVMGWTSLHEITEAGQYALSYDEAYKVKNETDDQYLILHNIQPTGWHSKMLGHGLLVYRIDYQSDEVNLFDFPNTHEGSPGVTVVPADGLLLSSYRVYKSKADSSNTTPYSAGQYIESQRGDPFPGSMGVNELLSVNLNRGVVMRKPLYNIHETDGIIYFDFLKKVATTGIQLPDILSPTVPQPIYTIDGRYVGTDKSVLPKGIYISGHKKFVVR